MQTNKPPILIILLEIITLVLFIVFHFVNYSIYIGYLNFLFPPYHLILRWLIPLVVVFAGTSVIIYFRDDHKLHLFKASIIFVIIFILIVIPAFVYVTHRQSSDPSVSVHDSLIQNEEAVRFVLAGKNPYTADYSQTPMADWVFRIGDVTINPALDHYPYLPVTFLFPLPIQAVFDHYLGWFDQRLIFVPLFILALVLCLLLASSWTARLLILISVGLCPFFAIYISEGRNDILVFFWLVLTLVALRKNRILLSAIFMGFACATKQLAWVFLPFYLLYISGDGDLSSRWRRIRIPLLVLASIAVVILLPWIWMDPTAFYQDAISFQSGMLADGYPINGMGFSMILLRMNAIASVTDPFPFFIIQIVIVLPVIVFLFLRQVRKNSVKQAVRNFGIALFLLLFFSRAFNNNYIGFILSILMIGVLYQPGLVPPDYEFADAPP